jgi:ABC-type nitrate/sulfonate/bicarbonate transport system permease component
MALAILAAPGILKLILSVFFSAFTVTGLGTAKGLENRDQALLEMAYVFFVPYKSRITYIDLPACLNKIVLSAMIAGPVSSVVGSAALFAAGSTPSIPHQAAAGILLLSLAALSKSLLKKNPGKGDSAA